MNKTRIIGIILFIIGVIFQLTIEKESIDFFSVILIGVGIGLLVGSWKNRIKK